MGPLTQNIDDKRSARALVEEPLRSAGYQFNKSETVDNILAWVQHYPSLIQIFMKEVVTSIKSKWDGPIEIMMGKTYSEENF